MRFIASARTLCGLALLGIAAAGCGDDTLTSATPTTMTPDRVFNQIERLGNPLVSEVFLQKRDHGFHNGGMPSTDVANFKTKVEGFVSQFGRSAKVSTTLSAVLLPDMLIVQTNRAGSTAGWLSWALADGYGGRKLNDDVVDAGLAAVFGTLLDTQGAIPSLASDNVPASVRTFGTTFPYLQPTN